MMHQQYRRYGLAVITAALLILYAACPHAVWATTLQNLLADVPKSRSYCAPSREAFHQAEALFHQLLQGGSTRHLKSAWGQLGFTMRSAHQGETRFLALVEVDGESCGRGAYLFRHGPAIPIALQAPHGFKDLHTRQIVQSLVAESQATAAAWNTAPRHFQHRGHTINADVAHLDISYFQAFSRAFARHYPQGHLIQIHGFAKHRRTTMAGAQADVILSSGSDQPSQIVRSIGQCLKSLVPGRVSIYPIDVKELGARTNTIGRALRQMGHTGFIHLELSRQLRQQLIANATSRQPFLHCLALATP